jgi:putative phage-type endonuclease
MVTTTITLQGLMETLWRAIPVSARECFDVAHLTQIVRAAAIHIPGLDSDSVPRLVEAFFARLRQVERLRNLTYAPQRSEAWLNQRKNLLTASDLASALNKGKFSSRSALLKKKIEARLPTLANSETGTGTSGSGSGYKCAAMSWGTMFEPMISRIYSEMHEDIELYEFGLVPHPTLTCFGASPDGITELGKMVEIKCPWRREIKMGEVPEQYMLQIQGQLSVCGLDECDYIEVVMEDLESKEAYFQITNEHETHAHGVILELQTAEEQQIGSCHYEYSPARLTPKEAFAWATSYIKTRVQTEPSLNIARVRPWKMKAYNLVTVGFDAPLWDTLVPQIETFWKDVEDGTVAATGTEMAVAPSRTRRAKKGYTYREETNEVPPIS